MQERCLALPNTTNLEGIVTLNREAVIQDLNSQNTGEFLKWVQWTSSYEVWDCCAASGGKSLMLYDMKADIKLTVSDVRENILHNLRKRFAIAGISSYKSFIMDLSANQIRLPVDRYQLIIADVPCNAGTWSRTPSSYIFLPGTKSANTLHCSRRFRRLSFRHYYPVDTFFILPVPCLKKENEDIVRQLEQNGKLQLIKMGILQGYDRKADTLFAALLKKPL